MARPIKSRHVNILPGATYFKPRGIPMAFLEEVTLTIDECEALRLADLEAYSHEKAAAKMKISRATFGRVVEKARYITVDALVNGKAIRIEGGNFMTGKRVNCHCRKCKERWLCNREAGTRIKCPDCINKKKIIGANYGESRNLKNPGSMKKRRAT